MRILILTPHYEPDLGPSAPLFTMLAERLVEHGHEVTVITTVPHYPSGKVANGFRSLVNRESVEGGVTVVRVPLLSLSRSKLSRRIVQFLMYQLGSTCAAKGRNFDVALVTNPALWVWLPFVCHVSRTRRPAVFAVFDVYPDVGVALGVFREHYLVRAVAGLERFCLRHSDIIGILSESFRPALKALGTPDEKMEAIDLWVDTHLIRPLPRCNSFAAEQGLTGKFVAMYAGNLGLSQGLECVLGAARVLQSNGGFDFVFVGEGSGRERLARRAAEERLANVRFVPFQPRARLPQVLATANASLIALEKGIAAHSVPSKLYSILASGRPVVAAVDEGSETRQLVRRSGSGFCVQPGDSDELARVLRTLRDNPDLCRRLGENGRRWAEAHHSPEAAATRFEQLLQKAINRRRGDEPLHAAASATRCT